MQQCFSLDEYRIGLHLKNLALEIELHHEILELPLLLEHMLLPIRHLLPLLDELDKENGLTKPS